MLGLGRFFFFSIADGMPPDSRSSSCTVNSFPSEALLPFVGAGSTQSFGSIASQSDYALQSQNAFQQVNNERVTSYLQGNDAHGSSTYTGWNNVDIQIPCSSQFNLPVDEATRGMMFSDVSPWDIQGEAATSSFEWAPDVFAHGDGVNNIYHPIGDSISNPPLQSSPLAAIDLMVGVVPAPAFNWEHGSDQFTETSSVLVATNPTRRPIRNSISK